MPAHDCARLRSLGAVSLDAWTREDAGTLAWYRAQGFTHRFHYLHVFAQGSWHRWVTSIAWEAEEDSLRRRFKRVYGCNQFVKPLN